MADEKRLIDANAEGCTETTKIKTHHARIVVDGTADKPYYSIEWYDPTKKEYYLGYSSYFIENVFNWLSECFEIVDAPTVDAVEVVHGRWVAVPSSDMMTGKAYKCSECGKMRYGSFMPNYCQICGAKMDGDGNGL